ncbi:hypothetical protein STANM309S_04955 [Streptomyces tanashiensis]
MRAAGVVAWSSHSRDGAEAASWSMSSWTVSPSRSTVLSVASRPLTRAPMQECASSPYCA